MNKRDSVGKRICPASYPNYTGLGDEAYSYDDNGNRISENGQSYQIDLNNRLQHDDTYLYEYDNEGNVIRREPVGGRTYTEYTWDHRNRLIQVTTGDEFQVTSVIKYSYDYLNQLVGRTVEVDGAVIKQTVYVHDQGQVALQFEKIGTGNLGAGDLSNRYLWGPAVDQLLADEQVDWSNQMADGEVLWALTDHLGTVRDLVDSTGTVQWPSCYYAGITECCWPQRESGIAVRSSSGFLGRLLGHA